MRNCEILQSAAFQERFQAETEFQRPGLGALFAHGRDNQRETCVLLHRMQLWSGQRPRGFHVNASDVEDTLARLSTIEHRVVAAPMAAAETPDGFEWAVDWDGVRDLRDAVSEIVDPDARLQLGLRCLAEVLGGISALHEAGLTHGNVVMHAIGVSPDGQPRLSGAIWPRWFERYGHGIHNFRFGLEIMGEAADLVGPAAVLYEMLAGVEPFDGTVSIFDGVKRSVLDVNPHAPRALAEHVSRILASRFPHGLDSASVRAELEALKSDIAALRGAPDGPLGHERGLR